MLGPEFDDFLYAPVGDDPNGMPLSVLSAMARQDMDAWHEAAALVSLPRQAAIEKLTSVIAAIPDLPSASAAPETIAARLIGLLPDRGAKQRRPDVAARGGAPTTLAALASRLWMITMLMTFALFCQWLVFGSRTPARVVKDPPSVPSQTMPRAPSAPAAPGR